MGYQSIGSDKRHHELACGLTLRTDGHDGSNGRVDAAHGRAFALALVDLQVASGVLHDGRAHHCGGENRMPAVAELAAHRGLDELGNARREVFVALAEIDELDGAPMSFSASLRSAT